MLFPCDECFAVFTTKLSRKRHKVSYHQFTKCPLCDGIFTNFIYRAYHRHQSTCASQYVAEVVTTRKVIMTRTVITTCKEQENEVYHCPLCDKTFTRLHSLKKHAKRHMTNNPVRCGYCGQFYLDVSSLTRHIRLRHSIDDRKYFECDMCNRRYTSFRKLEEHKQLHMGETMPQYHCIYCSNKYDKLGRFKEHLRKKHGNRAITSNKTCQVCFKTDLMREDMGANLIYICDACQKEMRKQDSLKPGGRFDPGR